MRTWKQYYTVLSGLELCFYKDRKDFQPVNICIFVKYYPFPAHISANEVIDIIKCMCMSNFLQDNTYIKADFLGPFYISKFSIFCLLYSTVEPLPPIDKSSSLWSK